MKTLLACLLAVAALAGAPLQAQSSPAAHRPHCGGGRRGRDPAQRARPRRGQHHRPVRRPREPAAAARRAREAGAGAAGAGQAAGRPRRRRPACASPTRKSTRPSPASPRRTRSAPEQLREQLARDGTSYNEFRGSIRDELLTQRLRQRFAQSRISVSEAEIDAALAAQQNAGAQFHLAHILVALPEGATPEQIATAQKKIEGVKALLDKGEMDFAAAAVRYSDSPNALEGGDLGWRSADEIPSAFAALIRDMKAGPGQRAVARPQRLPVAEAGGNPRRRAGRSPHGHRVPGAPHPDPRQRHHAPTRRPRPRPTPWRPASPAAPTSPSWRATSRRTRPRRARAATSAGSPRTRSVPTSAARSPRCRTTRSRSRSAPTPAGTSCSASAAARPTPPTRPAAPRSARRSAAASSRTNGTATCASCVAKPSSTCAPATPRRRDRATRPHRRPPTAAECPLPAARAGTGRAGRHWPGTVRAARPAAARLCTDRLRRPALACSAAAAGAATCRCACSTPTASRPRPANSPWSRPHIRTSPPSARPTRPTPPP